MLCQLHFSPELIFHAYLLCLELLSDGSNVFLILRMNVLLLLSARSKGRRQNIPQLKLMSVTAHEARHFGQLLLEANDLNDQQKKKVRTENRQN